MKIYENGFIQMERNRETNGQRMGENGVNGVNGVDDNLSFDSNAYNSWLLLYDYYYYILENANPKQHSFKMRDKPTLDLYSVDRH